ncbi:anion permease [Acidobacteriota bacterium]
MKNAFRWIIVISIFILVYLIPAPEGVTAQAWNMLAIFVATIVGLVLQPLPMGAVVILGVAASIMIKAVSYRDAMAGFANATVWLIVIAFIFARAFIITGLGRRIAFLFIRSFGKKTLGLAYAIALSDLVLAPATPSNTARAGGILFPVVQSLAHAFDSKKGNTARRIGAYLIKMEYQCVIVTSAMFMTAMAANFLAAELAENIASIRVSWGMWALGGIVPGIISLALIPIILYKLYPPEIKRTPEAVELARVELKKLGPMTRNEKALMVVFSGVLTLWITSQIHKFNATSVALVGLSALLLFQVIRWDDVLKEKGAWDALVWFGGLVMMAGQLNELGIISWFADNVSGFVEGWHWMPALIVLLLIYFYAHYGFASMTAHITALYPAFLLVAIAAGAPAYLAALSLGYFSNLNASMTHYATGPSPIYFGSGYIELKAWWKLGFIISVVNILIWIGVGFPYWKILGLW